MTPSLAELVKVPGYVKYLRTNYKLPAHLTRQYMDGTQRLPWRVWVKQPHPTQEGSIRWRKKDFPAYVPAWNLMVKALKVPGVLDVSLTCRPKGFAPTIELSHRLTAAGLLGEAPDSTFEDIPLAWCRYCRRPVQFGYFKTHHAIIGVEDVGDAARCPYCGIRRGA